MNKKKNKSKKRILILLLLLVATAVILTTSTYAWFTANKTVSVSNIQVNVDATGGLQLSVDAQNWKTIVYTDDIKNAHGIYTDSVNQVPEQLKPVSSALEMKADGKMKMFLGTALANDTGDIILTAEEDVEKRGEEGNFVAFDLFIKLDGERSTLQFTENTSVTPVVTADKGIQNAARMAFVKLGHAEAGTPVSDLQQLNDGARSVVKLLEPNWDVHTATGVAHAHNVYGETVQENGNAAPLAYSGVKARITKDDNLKWGEAKGNTNFVKEVTPDYKIKQGETQNTEAFTLDPGITKVRIYMWIEGQDVDCENTASGGGAIFNLQLYTDN